MYVLVLLIKTSSLIRLLFAVQGLQAKCKIVAGVFRSHYVAAS